MSRGACKVCSSPFAKEVNKRLGSGQSAPQIVQWLQQAKGFGVTRQTLYNHREHVTDPRTTFVEEARRNPAIKNVSNDEFLAAVVDAAAARVAQNPDDVTIEQGLKAVSVRESRRDKSVNILLAVAQYVTQRTPIDVIDGEYEVLGEAPEELTTNE